MKIFCLFCLLSFSVFAQNRAITDIQFFPKKGETYGQSFLAFDKYGKDAKGGGYQLDQTLGHSFADNMAAEVNINFVNQNQIEDDANRTTKGTSDPSFTFKYRLLDSRSKLDLIAGFIYPSGKIIVNDFDSNNKIGGTQMQVGAQYGMIYSKFQWATKLLYLKQFQYQVEVDNEEFKGTTHDKYQFHFEGRYLLVGKHLVGATLALDKSQSHKISGAKVDAEDTRIVEIGYFYHLNSDFLLKAGLQNSTREIGDDEFSINSLVVGMTYQF